MTHPDPRTSGKQNIASRQYYWLGLAVVAIVFALAAALTWRKWPDVLVDFGTQLYIPWRILHGAVLYRDLFYFAGGPFSQYFNALLFKIFGVSFSTLIAANLILTAAMIFAVYRGFFAAADTATATMIALAIVTVFAFAQYTYIGNYNYIAPYSHEATHGLILSIFTIALLSAWIKSPKTRTISIAGFCTGIVFLTKPDIFLALAATVIVAFGLSCVTHGRKVLSKSMAAFVLPAIAPSLFFFFYFLRFGTWRDSLHLLFFGWWPLIQGAVAKSPFYKWCLGLDAPLPHLRTIGVYFLALAGVVAVCALAIRWLANLKQAKLRYAVFLLIIAPLLYWAATFDWRQCGWPLPLLCLLAFILMAWNYRTLEQPPVFPLLWTLFGLILMAKLGFFPRIWHYGFVLAMPAFATSVYLFLWLLPKLLERKFGMPSALFRITAALVLLVGIGSLFNQSQTVYARKSFTMGTGGDKIVTYNLQYPATQGIYAALLWADKYVPTNATLAALPESVTLNYLTRRANPTPCLFWDPNCLSVFGQSTMTEAFEKNPPDYIFIVSADLVQFDAGSFGASPAFGQPVMEWVRQNYQSLLLIGGDPLKNGLFGVQILKRSSSTSPPNSPAAAPLSVSGTNGIDVRQR